MDIFDPPKFIDCHVEDHLDFFNHVRKLRCFVFRGHLDSDWEISSSFKREHKKYPESQAIQGAEQQSIDFFKKRAKSYELGVNSDSNLPDILSAMQHYGCPTRLVDFTQSFYVATYFAVNDANKTQKPYSIWAINYPVLNSKALEMGFSFYKGKESDFQLNEIIYQLLELKPLGIVPIEPKSIPRRMSAQQGVLLAQTNISVSFLENLCQMLGIDNKSDKVSLSEFKKISKNIINSVFIIKFSFSSNDIQLVRRELLDLNINSENLFPDLNGLAKSTVEHLFWQY